MAARAVATLVCAGWLVAACATPDGIETTSPEDRPPSPSRADYGPVRTALLADDLVSFQLTLANARGPSDMRDFSDCAAAQYALIRGLSYVRHVRTNLEQRRATWHADAAYTVSAERPRGTQTLDAAETVRTCRSRNIPMI